MKQIHFQGTTLAVKFAVRREKNSGHGFLRFLAAVAKSVPPAAADGLALLVYLLQESERKVQSWHHL